MKLISKKRHLVGLRKEIKFWKKPDILESQKFRTDRYIKYIHSVASEYGLERIENVLDAGCGPACLGQNIGSGRKWYLDPLLDSYREIFGNKIPKGEYISLHIEDAELKSDFFDIIVSFNALDHVQNPWLALKKIHSALKKGGFFLFSIYTRGPFIAFLRNLQEYLHFSTDKAHPYTFTVFSMNNELTKANFTIQSVEIISIQGDKTEHIWKCTK